MSVPDWPFQCPSSWSQKPRTSTIRSEVESGAPKSRARFTKSYLEVNATFVFETYDDATRFQTFFSRDLADGSLPFRMSNPMSGQASKWRFREPPTLASDVNKKPTATLECSLEEVL